MKNRLYKTFKEIDDPHLRFTIKGLADLYFDGDVNAALQEFNETRIFMDSIQTEHDNAQMHVQLQFSKSQ